jgi:hypothetical protein
VVSLRVNTPLTRRALSPRHLLPQGEKEEENAFAEEIHFSAFAIAFAIRLASTAQ